jgi:hypothetical protein
LGYLQVQVTDKLHYELNYSDCDNFAFAYKGLADLHGNGVGIVIGKMYKGWHAWNIAYVHDMGIVQVEPQKTRVEYGEFKNYTPVLIII